MYVSCILALIHLRVKRTRTSSYGPSSQRYPRHSSTLWTSDRDPHAYLRYLQCQRRVFSTGHRSQRAIRLMSVRAEANSGHIPLSEHSVLRGPVEQSQWHQRQRRKSQNRTSRSGKGSRGRMVVRKRVKGHIFKAVLSVLETRGRCEET